MSAQLTSLNGKISESFSNGQWKAYTALAAAFGENVPEWNGCHDGQFWTIEQLRKISQRTKQLAELVGIIDDLANNGGAKVS
jgi:hypothetical protein